MKNKKIKTALMVFIMLLTLIISVNAIVYASYLLTATDVSYTKPNGSTVNIKNALDELYTKVPIHEIGDEVTVGGERFYVLDWNNDSDTALLISKFNLNKAGTAQQNATYTATACTFSSTNYWGSSFNNSPFNLNDFIGFSTTDALGKAKSYGIKKGAVSSRLLSYEEANLLKNKTNSNSKIATMLWGKNSTNGFLRYWLGSASDYTCVWIAYSHSTRLATHLCNDGSDCGVRPVITVVKSKIS